MEMRGQIHAPATETPGWAPVSVWMLWRRDHIVLLAEIYALFPCRL